MIPAGTLPASESRAEEAGLALLPSKESPIEESQLVAEVKGIVCAGLMVVETFESIPLARYCP